MDVIHETVALIVYGNSYRMHISLRIQCASNLSLDTIAAPASNLSK